MGISEVRELCLSALTREDALNFLNFKYWTTNITTLEYYKLKKEIYKEFKI